MTTAIRVEGIGKRYTLGARTARYDTFRESLVRRLRHRGAGPGRRDEVWALRDVSFSVAAGEVVGLIGRNGAGKTTLLRLLSRITDPSVGRGEIHGRVGSLLEVGTGFHPELTGRENVFLNGAILGMRRREIERTFDEIVDFAGVDSFIDTPVKRYSTGMQVRLAFSVAAHLEPEILLVDEVLAVGDAEFQRKCLGRMQEVGESGRTVVLVSHNMGAITRLCSRAILLDRGRLVSDGPATTVVTEYLQGVAGSTAQRTWSEADAPGDELARLRDVAVVTPDGEARENHDARMPVGIRIAFDVLGDGPPVVPQLRITNEHGTHAFYAIDTHPRWHAPSPPGRHASTAWIPGNLLNEGLTTVTVLVSTLTSGRTLQHVREFDVVSFNVTDPGEGDSAKGRLTGQWHAAVRPLLHWSEESTLAGPYSLPPR